MKPDTLFYANPSTLEVQEVPYTRDRAMSVTPLFHSTRKKALQELRPKIEEAYRTAAEKLFSLWAELDDETETGLSKEDVRLFEKYGTATLIDNLKRLEAAESIIGHIEQWGPLRSGSLSYQVKEYREAYPKNDT